MLKSYEYDAFGKEVDPSTSDSNPFRYAGQYYDTENGTYYLRARYYSPTLGRFTQQDGWGYGNPGDPLSLNLYVYCYNDPVQYYDPSGRIGILGILALAIGAALALSSCSNDSSDEETSSFDPDDPEEFARLAPGLFTDIDACIENALSDMEEQVTNTPPDERVEIGCFVCYDQEGGYYYHSQIYDSRNEVINPQERILVKTPEECMDPEDGRKALIFLHVHLHDNNTNIIWNESEFPEMKQNPERLNMVLAFGNKENSVYYLMPHEGMNVSSWHKWSSRKNGVSYENMRQIP